jgi:hypothetical protein
LLYFQVCSSVFPSCVQYCCVMDHTYQSHKSFYPSTFGLLQHLFSMLLTALFSSGWLNILGRATNSCLSDWRCSIYSHTTIKRAWKIWWFWHQLLSKSENTVL